jgi:signal transduction histidine kinase
MENLLQQLKELLIQPPGNLIYHLILAFSVFAALQTALVSRRGKQNGRVLLGLNLVLLSQLALFLVSGLAWQGVVSFHLFLPLFERAVIDLSLLWIGWMWAFPESSEKPQRNLLVNLTMGLLNLGILILFFVTYNQWANQGATLALNSTWLDWVWSFVGVGIVVLSLAAVILRRPEGWALGVGMALVNLAGLLAHIFIPQNNEDYSAILRLAQLAAYPLLPGLMARQGRSLPAGEIAGQTSAQVPARATRSIDLRTVHAWVDLNLQDEPAKICTGVARAVAQSLFADLCYVVTAPDGGHGPVILQGGYDLVREDELPGTFLEHDRVPTLANALQKGRGMRIIASEIKPVDLNSLAEALSLKEIGNVLLIPLTRGGLPWGGLLLLSPYSNRVWTTDEMNSFSAESESITAILSRAQDEFDSRQELEKKKENLLSLAREVETLRQQNQQQSSELASLRKNPLPPPPELEALIAVQQETQEMLGYVQAENTRLKALVARGGGDQATAGQAESDLRTALQEIARLQNQLVQSNSRLLELERKIENEPSGGGPEREMINSLIQDMRQPMSSIMGYTDLLLAESLGILGKGQRNFVERIRASGERMRVLLDDVVNLTSSIREEMPAGHSAVDIPDILDQAVAEIRPQLIEHSLQLHLDLPERLPALHTDRESLQQIIGHLVQNAITASPAEGTISLRARQWHEENNEFVIFQITDNGGGIANEDLPRVFARHYGAEKTPVAGTGDSGVGLALSKTLTLALGGRIWVESVPGRSTTFTVLLPTHPLNPQPNPPAEIPAE